MDFLRGTAQFLATLSCSLFAGAALYINLVEHPARMVCGTETAATEFVSSYRRATVMQASLTVVQLRVLNRGVARGRQWLVASGRHSDRSGCSLHLCCHRA